MNISKSKFVALESIPLVELFKKEVGSMGLYLPLPDDNGSYAASVAKIASNAKAYAVKADKKCVVSTILCLENVEGEELPITSKMLKITVTEKGSLTLAGERYIKAKGASIR